MSSLGAAEEINDEENGAYDYDDDDFEVRVDNACTRMIFKWFSS